MRWMQLIAGFSSVILLGSVLAPGPATAQTEWPVAEAGNGHFYEPVLPDEPLNWEKAASAAASMFYRGSRGHLVTITSEAEHDFVNELFVGRFDPADFPANAAAWMGLTDVAEEGTWEWVTDDEEFDYGTTPKTPPWNASEPNGGPGPDDTNDCVGFYPIHPTVTGGVWNDFDCERTDEGALAYVVEFDGPFDSDGDGIYDDPDVCPDTVLPDQPTHGLKGSRFAAETNGELDAGKDKFDGLYTLADTRGCSATQIIELEELGPGHTKFGISKSALEGFIAGLNGA